MLFRKLLRTAWKYKVQFISMFIMVAIGMGVFLGANIEWYSLKNNTTKYFEETQYYDYRIYTENIGGFTVEEVEQIKEIKGVDNAIRYLSVNVGLMDTDKGLNLVIQEKTEKLQGFFSTSGNGDLANNALFISDRFAEENNINLGDSLTLTFRNLEIIGEVVQLGKSSEHLICVPDENQLMPDYKNFGFVYASPDLLESFNVPFIYPQIGINSSLKKEVLKTQVYQELGYNPIITTKEEHMAYSGAKGEIEEGKTMGSIIPILFLLIAILTMVTTMHRITVNEKTQIGTLKALGFKKKRITHHYISYGLFVSVVGTIAAIFLGYGIATLIVGPNGMQKTYIDLPSWELHIPWWCIIILFGSVLLLTVISYLSVRKIIKGTAAEILRPYVPRKVKSLMLEKTYVWNKLSFATKWNLRDICRHKARSVMTLIGIVGCMILLVGGLGMKDTMLSFLNTIDNSILKYETRVNISSDASKDDVRQLSKDIDGDLYASTAIVYNDKSILLEIYNIEHDNYGFIDDKDENLKIGNDGVYLCLRLSHGVKKGDNINVFLFGSEEAYRLKVAGFYHSYTSESIVMSEQYAQTIGISYTYSAIFTQKTIEEIEPLSFIENTQSQSSIMESYNTFLEIMDMMVFVFALGAIVLGIVVLYNLGTMSYIERSRELATLKVVGFNDRHIRKILIAQNMWLTTIGIIIGILAGIGVLYALIIALASEFELSITIGVLTYCGSVLLTFGVSLLVGLLIARKSKKINMVEALKSVD